MNVSFLLFNTFRAYRTLIDSFFEGTDRMKTSRILGAVASLVTTLAITTNSWAATANFDFSTTGGGILDAQGQGTGLTVRLSGTGTAIPTNDPSLDIDTAAGKLRITTGVGTGVNQDFNGSLGLDTTEAIGLNLSSLGYTGTQDFIVTATFDPLTPTQSFDQAGIFIGQDGFNLTKAGHITFSAQEYFAGHTTGTGPATDNNGRFFGFGFNGADGMNVTITRFDGDWRYFIDGVEWQPNTDGGGNGTPVDPTGDFGSPNLQALTDLTVGVFAINVVNTTSEVVSVDNFRVIVDPVVGDASGNGSVGPEDFTLISNNLFTNVIPGLNGDVTFDGFVGYDDFRTWKNVAPLSALIAVGIAVPEPGSLCLIGLALAGITGGRRNRR